MSISDKRFKSTKKIDFIFEFFPDQLEIKPDEYEKLNSTIIQILEKENSIRGLSIVSIHGTQPFAIAKSKEEFQKLSEISSVVEALNPQEFFQQISDEIEYRGLGHLTFDDFDIYFTRINDSFAVALHLSDIKLQVFKAAEQLITKIKETFLDVSLKPSSKFTMNDIKSIMESKIDPAKDD
ncbi:MAG: hypothetical protein HeimC2_02890 [Candidatus Heimdallarchaeota archaeon LC_2]|nr:MAG: hypothetical protein HeimC2_02890 [Candidatus Heimdallarchaeota archaeon LC_2]